MSEKILQIPFLDGVKTDTAPANLSTILDKLEKQTIGYVPWAQFSEKPSVTFTIAQINSAILLKYYVAETETLTRYKQPNEPVYRDSCVEFFIAFDEEGYYNLEFNSI